MWEWRSWSFNRSRRRFDTEMEPENIYVLNNILYNDTLSHVCSAIPRNEHLKMRKL